MPFTEKRGNKWRVRWWSGKLDPATGKKLYDSRSGFYDEAKAYDYGLDQESALRNDRYISRRDGSTLMRDYCRTWPDSLDVGHLRDKAIRSMLNLYIVPRWGDAAVADIKTSMFRAWEKQLRTHPTTRGKPLSKPYVDEIIGVFRMLMDDAVADEMRSSSPVPVVNKRRGRYVKKAREKKREMVMEDVFQLATNALTYWGFQGFVFVLTKAFTGMRPAELYALRREYCHPAWPTSDPDKDQRREAAARYGAKHGLPAIRVEYQHQREHGALGLFPPKYESHRSLVIPPFLAELHEMLAAAHSGEFVFTSIGGGLLANANFSYHYWRRIADGQDPTPPKQGGKARGGGSWRPLPGWPAVEAWTGKRLYLVRHGHKSWLDEDGHSRIATEARMGHEVAGVEGLYSMVTLGMERQIAGTLQERWEKVLSQLPEDWELPPSPTSLPVDLNGWMNKQVKAAKEAPSQTGS